MRSGARGLLLLLAIVFLTGRADAQFGVSNQAVINAGIQAHQQLIRQYGIWNDPAQQSRVDRLGALLTRFSKRPEIHYRFYPLNSGEINAMATPDGSIHITRGLLQNFPNDNELLFILGHEITHVELNHAQKQIEQAQATQAGEDVLSMLFGQNSSLANLGIQGAGYWLMMKYSRDDEYQADQGGMQLLQKAGINPHWGVRALRHLASLDQSQPSLVAQYFSDHPLDDARIARAQQAADSLQPASTTASQPQAQAAPIPSSLLPLSRGVIGGRVWPVDRNLMILAYDVKNNLVGETHPNRKGYYRLTVPEGHYSVNRPDSETLRFLPSNDSPGIAVRPYKKTPFDIHLNP